MKNKITILAIAAAALVFDGCSTTQTTAADGTTTKVTRFDTQDAQEALLLANTALANPLVSNALYQALSPK